MIAFDTETHPFSRGKLAPRLVSGSACPRYEGAQLLDREGCRDLVFYTPKQLLGVNIAYDMGVMCADFPELTPTVFARYEQGNILDVGLVQKMIDIAQEGSTRQAHGRGASPYSLEGLASRYAVVIPEKDPAIRLTFSEVDGLPFEEWSPARREYALSDASAPMDIYELQLTQELKWREETGMPLFSHLIGFEATKAFSMHLLSCWGLHADPQRVAALREATQAYIDEAQVELTLKGLVRPNGTRNIKAAATAMRAACEVHGLPVRMTEEPKDRTATKVFVPAVCLDKEACAASMDPLMELYSDFSQASLLMSRVEDLAQGFEFPLQPSFDTLLETGRTSSYKPKPPLCGVQSQNFPRQLPKAMAAAYAKLHPGVWLAGPRECLTPRPGTVFVACDLPAAELRSVAQECLDMFGCSKLAELLNAGQDPHLYMASQILGVPYEELVLRAKEPEVQEKRGQAKPVNFGAWGGMGAPSLRQYSWDSYRVRFTLKEAQNILAVWKKALPETALYFGQTNRLLRDREKVRRFRHTSSGRWRGQLRYCQLNNTRFQERTANAAYSALNQVQAAAYADPSSPLWNLRTVLCTHDEIVAEAPLDRAHDAAIELSRVMAEAFNVWHPDVPVIPCTGPTNDPRVIQPCLMHVYTKGAKTVWNNSTLVPSNPY